MHFCLSPDYENNEGKSEAKVVCACAVHANTIITMLLLINVDRCQALVLTYVEVS